MLLLSLHNREILLLKSQQKVSPVIDEVFTYPNPSNKPKKVGGVSAMPKHLSGDQVIQFLEEHKQRKLQEERAKRKAEREMKKKRREDAKENNLKGARVGLKRKKKREGTIPSATVLPHTAKLQEVFLV